MSEQKKFKKHYPPHKYIPADRGKLTALARELYDLVYDLGLKGCWMSNRTIAKRLGCSKLSVQRCRKQLEKRQVIVSARAGRCTWRMWARYHKAVRNCPVLRFRQGPTMDNPFYISEADSRRNLGDIDPTKLRYQKPPSMGNKMLPKLNITPLRGGEGPDLDKESGKSRPDDSSISGRCPETRDLRRVDQRPAVQGEAGEDSWFEDHPEARVSEKLDPFGRFLFRNYYNAAIDKGYDPAEASSLANAQALERRAHKHKPKDENEQDQG